MSALDDIRQRAEAATTGPWDVSDANEGEWPPRPFLMVANDAFHNPGDDDDSPWLAVELHTGIKEDAEFIAHARTDIPRLLAALDAVLAMHTEDEQGKCAECTFAPFSVHSVKWPCPTVAAVKDALEAGK